MHQHTKICYGKLVSKLSMVSRVQFKTHGNNVMNTGYEVIARHFVIRSASHSVISSDKKLFKVAGTLSDASGT